MKVFYIADGHVSWAVNVEFEHEDWDMSKWQI